MDNEPLVLMVEGEVIAENLRRARVTRDDVLEKLRQANVHRLSDVRAVVLETTGDVSVLSGDVPLDDALLDDVRGFDAGGSIQTRDAGTPVPTPKADSPSN